MTKPKGTNREKVRAFCFAHFRKGGSAHEQKKETADLAGALRRQGRSRGGIKESQTKGKNSGTSDFQADPQRKNTPSLHQNRDVGELPAKPGAADGR